ncbi:myrosinase 1-like [Schistocerca piceifrons]|uniref:myrosinase 1-like n=1 Tax=Schistocerca piceifrons TaxID=274613 RepID=UPI001F5F024E|nr:myrosinase 1-like [Schistocerca piceifrons]
MYHWDLPQALQYLGGWVNEIMVDYFADYAKLLFDNYGDRVKWWITFNDPVMSVWGYAIAGVPPGLPATGVGDYLATHTLVKAHARVWHLYDEQYRATQNGSVGMTFSSPHYEPYTNSTEDVEATERQRQFKIPLDQSAAGFRQILNWLVAEYPGYPIFVSENGLGNDGSVGLNDTDRVEYFAAFLPALLQAVNLDNVPVVGYTCWSLMDNLEWQLGYS